MGATVSKEVDGLKELAKTVRNSYDRDPDWVEYHAETLAESMEPEAPDVHRFGIAAGERKAFNLWHDGYHEKAIARLLKVIAESKSLDPQTRGWLQQLAARVASNWGQGERADELQRDAYGNNRNLLRPKVPPPYRPLPAPSAQAVAIALQLRGYRVRRGLLQHFEEVVSHLHAAATANQFEQSLAELALLIGLSSERYDNHGVGPDVLWLLPQLVGLVIEAKSRKNGKNVLTKEEHGQLLVAEEWFAKNYQGYKAVRVSVHPSNKATKAAAAGKSYSLTYEKLNALIADARVLLTKLCESQRTDAELEAECARVLDGSPVRADHLIKNYLLNFIEE